MGEERDKDEREPKSNWKFGVYFNRDDPRWLVPDLGGMGMTVNFAKVMNQKGLDLLVLLILVVVLAKIFW